MAWIVITQATLNEAKVAALISACSSSALGDSQDERVAGLIQGVVNEVRSSIASCATNRVDADPTRVPDNLRDLCVDLIVARLKNAVELPLTQDERDNLSWRRKQLESIASCQFVIDQPDDPITPEVESPAPAPAFGTRGGSASNDPAAREFTRDTQAG
jgi:hypothetical protein